MERKQERKKQNYGFRLAVLLLFCCCMTAAVIQGSAPVPLWAAQEENVQLNATSVTISTGERVTLSVSGNYQKVIWRVNRRSIATVSNKGVVKGVSAGTTNVIATIDGVEYKCKIKVEKPTLNKSNYNGIVGNTYTLKLKGTSRSISFQSSDTAVVKVSSAGKMSFLSPGTAKVSAMVGKSKYTCDVTVPKPSITVPSVKIGETASIDFDGKTYKKLSVKSSNPEVASVDSKGQLKGNAVGSTVITVQIANYVYQETIQVENTLVSAVITGDTNGLDAADAELAAAANALYKDNVTAEMTDVEKIKAIHDAVVNNTAYGYVTDPQEVRTSFTIEGVLIHHTAVCQGYAETMQLFFDAMGIENQVLYVIEMDHAWNLVKLEGSWYHIDATWDDPRVYGKDIPGFIAYNYFLLDDEQIEKDHFWRRDKYPAAEGGKYSSYIVEKFRQDGAVLDSAREFEDACLSRFEQGIFQFTLLYPEDELFGLESNVKSMSNRLNKGIAVSQMEYNIGGYIALILEFNFN